MTILRINDNLSLPVGEVRFRTSRSRGPGGQNVNKLETRVELEFDVRNSPSLSERQRTAVLENLQWKIDARGILRVVSQETRSQWSNKKLALERFSELLRRALKPRRERKTGAPPKHAREERLRSKKLKGEKKNLRKVPRND